MDKSWMCARRTSKEYQEGVNDFIEFGKRHASNPDKMHCPCLKCGNSKICNVSLIKDHLFFNGIDKSYRCWDMHGEELDTMDSTRANGFLEKCNADTISSTIEMVEGAHDQWECNPEEFKKLLEDAEKPLYTGCKNFTKLSALVKLYNLKARYGLSDQSFSELLKLLGEMLPEHNEMFSSLYEAKRTLNSLGMGYEKIHACPNDCILYRNEYKNETTCPTCGLSRWKAIKNSTEGKAGVPAKVLWYFPPIPRFRRMFQSIETSKNLTWHANEREDDGQLHHPADNPAWKLIDHLWPDFAVEPRNLRLAISEDGINPHSSLSSRYSCWPVIMVTYNLPPWLSMKRKFMMLTLLISGPKQPGNDIDVYLAPLVEDLKTLWEVGIEAYDAYRRESFKLKAILMWTINDFPAYGNLAGCTVKGYYACPICGEQTYSRRLKHSKKMSFTGHRRFLPRFHPYRIKKKAFNGEQEFGLAPEPLIGEEVLMKVDEINLVWGKRKVHKRKKKIDCRSCWKKKSIFFDLDYWKSLHVRHVLDVMHIEKNVCESLVGTLLDMPGKTKDGLAARKDLEEMGLRSELAPNYIEDKKVYLPAACYTLSKKEKQKVCQTLFDIKAPTGYSSNFRNLVSMEDFKLYGLKSHDCHTLMQQLLPVAIRSVLPKHVRYVITKFCLFFNALCNKVVDVSRLDQIQEDLVKTLCLLETIFPPAFFDIMVHLTVHLIREVKLCGPVYLRWMYPFERYMKILKGYVRNRNRPEGCIAECYIAEEAVEFCTEYFSGVDEIGIPSCKNNKHVSSAVGKPLSGGYVVRVNREECHQAHRYVLENTNEVQPYIKVLFDEMKKVELNDKYKFGDPSILSHTSGYSEEARVLELSEVMANFRPHQLLIFPYNHGAHWMLVILDPNAESVYFFDSLGLPIRKDLNSFISVAYRVWATKKGKTKRMNINWMPIFCPRQVGNTECGYYVMKYMKTIVENQNIPVTRQYFDGRDAAYTQAEVDEVRSQWADFVWRFI